MYTVRRYTPTCAGKTFAVGFSCHSVTIHPRLRGENHIVSAVIHYDEDTPPLARGKPSNYRKQAPTRRYTPACAGKTLFFYILPPFYMIHPRLRGENSSLRHFRLFQCDTPPLARGKPSAFMRVCVTSNTSLCKLHKKYFDFST